MPARRSEAPRGQRRPTFDALDERIVPSVTSVAPSVLTAPATSTTAPSTLATVTQTATAAPSILGPVSLQSFTQSNGQLFANGTVTAPGGALLAFSTPVSVTTQPSTTTCTVLHLVLGPVDLNLLGLQVHLDKVDLLVTAMPGPGQILGNLLCPDKGAKGGKHGDLLGNLGDSLNMALPMANSTVGLTPTSGALGSFTNTVDYQQLADSLTAAAVPVDTMPCPILHLSIQQLDLDLLGLRVQSLNPIVLDITAIPGPGNLLGNLFCQVAHLLDGGLPTNTALANSTVSTMLSALTGGLVSTLPGTSGFSTAAATSDTALAAAAAQGDATTSNTCTILSLVLGPVDLNLLGLQVHLDEVDLLITATSGPGNLLGNLLCPDNNTSSTKKLSQGVALFGQTVNSTTSAGTATTATAVTSAADTSSATDVSADPMTTCPILHLTIGELGLNLLGLRVQSLKPIVLDITAIPGPGNLLGNLFCDLAHLLDNTTLGSGELTAVT